MDDLDLITEIVAADCVDVEFEPGKYKANGEPGACGFCLTALPDSASFDSALDALDARGVPA